MKRPTVRPGSVCRYADWPRSRAGCWAKPTARSTTHQPRRQAPPHRLIRPRATMSEHDPAAGLQPLEIDALVEARHPDPFSQLGPHQTDAGPVVRALLPNAAQVTVIARADGATL